MNILILISSLNFGGAEKQALLDANMLSKEQDVFLATFHGGALESQLLPGVKVSRFDKTSYIKTAFRIAQFVRKNKIQIIHTHLFASSVLAALAGLICNVKVIWHFHGHRYEEGNEGKKTLSCLSKLPHVRRLLFVNTELISYYSNEGYNFPKDKCRLLYNSSPQQSNHIKKSRTNIFKIGYLGRIVELKRVKYLVELAEWLKSKGVNDFSIEIIGDGPLLNNLKELSQQLKITDVIDFKGFQTDIAHFYSTFDLFILPSREECLSLALIDAGVWGLPALAFQVGGNDEIIKDGETGYIVQTKEELFEKTLYLYTNSEVRLQMGIAARYFCTSTFGESHHLEELMSIYKGL